jgi:hypothetical protein
MNGALRTAIVLAAAPCVWLKRPALKENKIWCGQEDSNLHGSPRYHLKVVRLPFRHDREYQKGVAIA